MKRGKKINIRSAKPISKHLLILGDLFSYNICIKHNYQKPQEVVIVGNIRTDLNSVVQATAIYNCTCGTLPGWQYHLPSCYSHANGIDYDEEKRIDKNTNFIIKLLKGKRK